ncbi:polysaccharide biosynthesis/export family protein [Silvibacterium acidisoli]|uniref:polysaccharide biosynthesis/export family protein n=1 Tax=Acidobacteriaceae bacterium ZG23-2 TaxID=2883246 RepID=UPI00406C2DF9
MRTSKVRHAAALCLCVLGVTAFAQTSPTAGATHVDSKVAGQVENARAEAPQVIESTAQANQPNQQVPPAEEAPQILIGPGDLITIDVFDTPELSGPARVNQRGDINLTVLGDLHVAGMTAGEAARAIEAKFKSRDIMRDPHVTIAITEYATQGATITGEVKTPGLFPTLGSRRLLEMIAMAGGVTQMAGKTVSIIHRDDPRHPVNVSLVPNTSHLQDQYNPIILPGDTVVVDKSGIVYILGAVNKPGGYLVDNNEHLSLLQAVTLAGGWLQTASLSGARLVRKVPEGREEVKIDLKHVTYGRQADIKVENGDILFVPASVGKIFLYQGIQEAVIGAEQAGVYQAYNR